jgi:hypothetical protein
MNLWKMVNPLTAPKKLGQIAVAPFQGSVNDKPWLQSTARTATGAALGENPEKVGQKYLGDPMPATPSASASGAGQGTPAFSVPGQGGAAPGTTSQPISFGQQQQAKGNAVDPQVQQAIGMFLGTLPPLVGMKGSAAGGGAGSSLSGGSVVGAGGVGDLGGGLVQFNPSDPNGTVAGGAPGYVYPGNPVVQN